MNYLNRLALLVLGSSLLAACSNNISEQITRAPMSQEEAGLIVSGSSMDIQEAINLSKSYRVISAKHNVYELKGIALKDLQSLSPNLKVDKNQYFESMIDSKSNKENSKAQLFSNLANDSETAEVQNIPPALQGCDLQADLKPTATIALTSTVLSESPTMNLGEEVAMTASNSFSHLESPNLDYRWEIMPPNGSKLEETFRQGETLNFAPDNVGMYQLALVVKADDDACGIRMVRFLVTHNPDIELATAGEAMPMIALDPFTHLEKIRVPEAWEEVTGKGVKIAVLDTGLHYNHRAIKFNLAIKTEELNSSTDVDGNGFEGDFLGWDFVNNDNKPFDDEGHGSHVGGLTSSHIHGSAKESLLMPVKVLNAAGGGDVASVIAGIYYAVDNGAQVINASLQRLDNPNNALLDAIQYAHDKNVVFISASGNDGLDLSDPANEIYPGEISVPSLINVGATGVDNGMTSYSNFGQNEVDVAAPGGDGIEPIYSLATLNAREMPFIGSAGTSMAAPIVAGVAALMIEANPNITNQDVRTILMDSGNALESLNGAVGSGRLLDAKTAVDAAKALAQSQWSANIVMGGEITPGTAYLI